ncbi:MAG: helix-turn-helix transcriptional regulator [Deltaproteobacteria bacterium]|nr:helix-turn-helix transcriptional regulator [Deltaproteobacteria bacterium]
MTFDLIAAVEACYAPAGDDEEWLSRLLEALASLDLGEGLTARIHEGTPAGGLRGRATAQRGHDRSWSTTLDSLLARAPAGQVRRIFHPWPVVRRALASARRSGWLAEQLTRLLFASQGHDDSWGILAGAPGQALLDIGIPFRGQRRLPPRTVHGLRLLSAHLTTALRLRDRIRQAPSPGAEVEAVLDPGGRVHHAASEARGADVRESLAAAVRRVERARGSLRRASPEEAADLWTGLVDGRWTLVDRCESDGRRIVLARRNEPRVYDPRALTDRERSVLAHAALGHSNKYVAYLLGLAPSTVAAHLASARRKLGLRTRPEMLAFGRAVGIGSGAASQQRADARWRT